MKAQRRQVLGDEHPVDDDQEEPADTGADGGHGEEELLAPRLRRLEHDLPGEDAVLHPGEEGRRGPEQRQLEGAQHVQRVPAAAPKDPRDDGRRQDRQRVEGEA
jgi:hypothetical protein